MKKILGVFLAFSMLVAVSFLFSACQEKAPEGQLPVFQVGDEWVWNHVMNETTYTLTEEVTGYETVEGRDCYIVSMLFDPVISSTYEGVVYTVTDIKYWGDKATGLLGVKMERSVTGDGQTFTSSEIYSYDPWINLFPLEIGKVVEAERTITQYSGGMPMGTPVVSTERYTVESKEDVTVVAGTFNCWKIIMYDSASNITQTMWYSDQVKTGIKMTDDEGNTIVELKSYSVD